MLARPHHAVRAQPHSQPRARWERSLGEVTTALRARLRRTLPGLAHEHHDLLHDTLTSLTTHAQRALREGTAPAMWADATALGPLEGGPRPAR